jgi:hypothetical protein
LLLTGRTGLVGIRYPALTVFTSHQRAGQHGGRHKNGKNGQYPAEKGRFLLSFP